MRPAWTLQKRDRLVQLASLSRGRPCGGRGRVGEDLEPYSLPWSHDHTPVLVSVIMKKHYRAGISLCSEPAQHRCPTEAQAFALSSSSL